MYEIRKYKDEINGGRWNALVLYSFKTGFAVEGDGEVVAKFDALEEAKKAALDFRPSVEVFQQKEEDSPYYESIAIVTEYTIHEQETGKELSLYDYAHSWETGTVVTLAEHHEFHVDFGGGVPRDETEGSGCNYMICSAINGDGEVVELYAEYLYPDYRDYDDFDWREEYYSKFLKDGWSLAKIAENFPDGEGLDYDAFFDYNKFDDISFAEMKEEILEQAEEFNVDPKALVFD